MTKRKAKEREKKETQRRPRRMQRKPITSQTAAEAGLLCFCKEPAEYLDPEHGYVCTNHKKHANAIKLATDRTKIVKAAGSTTTAPGERAEA